MTTLTQRHAAVSTVYSDEELQAIARADLDPSPARAAEILRKSFTAPPTSRGGQSRRPFKRHY